MGLSPNCLSYSARMSRDEGYNPDLGDGLSTSNGDVGVIEEYFDPPIEPGNGLLCPICLAVLREPIQTLTCCAGQRFCRSCFLVALREFGNKCLTCNKLLPLEPKYFRDIFAQREVEALTTRCRYYRQGCEWKGALINLKDHNCLFVKCPQKCGSVICKTDFRQVHVKVCPNELCPLCKTGILRHEFQVHVNKCQESTFMPDMIRDVALKVQDLMRRCNIPCQFDYDNAVSQDDDLKSVDDKLKLLENRLLDFKGRASKGTFIWKIDNYEQCHAQAVDNVVPAIHSPPFYTDLYGYKMCLRMNLNGVDSGLCCHVSLFVHMMQGEWDDILEWPFTGRITLAILDQSDDVDFRRPISETLVAKPNLLAFKKPTTHRNHKGYGYVEFCQIDQLVQGQFVKNNSMLVRLQVFY